MGRRCLPIQSGEIRWRPAIYRCVLPVWIWPDDLRRAKAGDGGVAGGACHDPAEVLLRRLAFLRSRALSADHPPTPARSPDLVPPFVIVLCLDIYESRMDPEKLLNKSLGLRFLS